MAFSDIIVSPAKVYVAPVGEPEVADTVAADADWGGNWVNIALTETPLTANYETEELDIKVEQVLSTVKRVKTSEDLMLESMLSEFTLDNMQYGTQGTVVVTAAGVGQPAKEELDVGGVATLDELAWGFEGVFNEENGEPFPVRVYVWRATAKLGAALEFGKATQTGISLQIKALAQDINGKLYKVVRITGAALP